MRIVVEHENPLVAGAIAEDLEAAGHSVVTCRGPSLRDDRPCPVVDGDGHCLWVEDADVVLAALPTEQLSVYIGLRTGYGLPVVLSLSAAERVRIPVLERIGPWAPRNLRGPALAEALEAAVRGSVA
jgi:hypothetical protein